MGAGSRCQHLPMLNSPLEASPPHMEDPLSTMPGSPVKCWLSKTC